MNLKTKKILSSSLGIIGATSITTPIILNQASCGQIWQYQFNLDQEKLSQWDFSKNALPQLSGYNYSDPEDQAMIKKLGHDITPGMIINNFVWFNQSATELKFQFNWKNKKLEFILQAKFVWGSETDVYTIKSLEPLSIQAARRFDILIENLTVFFGADGKDSIAWQHYFNGTLEDEWNRQEFEIWILSYSIAQGNIFPVIGDKPSR